MLSIGMGIYRKLVELGITPNIYRRELRQNPSYPATVYDVVSDNAIGTVHDAGVHCFREARVQIDIYALTVAEAESIAEQYFDALDNYHGTLSDETSPETTWDVRIRDAGMNPDMNFQEQPTLRRAEGRSRDYYILY